MCIVDDYLMGTGEPDIAAIGQEDLFVEEDSICA